jgi:hypothetical protein
MKTTGRPEAIPPIFVGKWTTYILFSLGERSYRHGRLRRRLRDLAANAHQNSSQSRIRQTHREECDGSGRPRYPVFVDRTRARIHRPSDGYVQLGQAAR